ncbi:SDR family NAD(P)-dependent oxidoreductase [Ideonella azotifigens]|uniref:SDR family NAD(P)-dependent oxidoreductase n=1 Tax=Ideonella azotifigens TaxID=513160 RepID=A0ABP3UYY5_9BURK|nr:SDR family NAD(P)-dependent oxidoreductase [Ideonella azotifigens]MCD2339735.1 SDR family NAD(P)-dependent oxidoreductase [Ideonella azotifigens]
MSLNPRIPAWQGQVVWLVGASSGIGRALAERLHAAGAVVVCSARHEVPLNEFVARHPGSQAIALDVTDRDSLQAAAQTVVARHGRLDMVVYCAGHYRALRATAFDLVDALRHDQINYVGALNLLDAVLPVLLRQRSGHLSLISSVAGYRGLPNSLAYGPTKAALINLAECLYCDLHAQGIGVSVVCPGFVDTPLVQQNEHAMPALISADEAARQMLAGWAVGDFSLHFPKRFTRWMRAARYLPDALYFPAVRRVTGL